MDQFEKKIRELYQEKRKRDEKTIPEFNNFMNRQIIAKPVNRLRIFYIRAASVAAIAIPAVLILYYFNSSNRVHQQLQEVLSVNINQPLPSQSLLNSVNSAAYIWQWKSPTDKLLQDATKSITMWKYKKI